MVFYIAKAKRSGDGRRSDHRNLMPLGLKAMVFPSAEIQMIKIASQDAVAINDLLHGLISLDLKRVHGLISQVLKSALKRNLQAVKTAILIAIRLSLLDLPKRKVFQVHQEKLVRNFKCLYVLSN